RPAARLSWGPARARIGRAGGCTHNTGRRRLRNAWALSTFFFAGALALVLVLVGPGARAQAGDTAVPLDLAYMETPVGTTLDDILSGRAQPGFTPVLTPGFPFTAREGRVLWVRI